MKRGGWMCLLLTACGGGASGEIAVETWGEAFIEEGIDAAAFADGWSVRFERFLIVIGDVRVADEHDHAALSLDGGRLVDLVAPGPHPLGSGVLEARIWPELGYSVLPASEATMVHPSATSADLEMMRAAGTSIYVSGEAERQGVTKRFAWGFDTTVRYRSCVDISQGQELPGIIVPDGGRALAQLTVHGDHLFYDDLQSPAAALRFESLAEADADGDGEVTLAELDQVPLATIDPSRGPYGVGAADVNTLGEYVRAATRSLGHYNGEGHCETD